MQMTKYVFLPLNFFKKYTRAINNKRYNMIYSVRIFDFLHIIPQKQTTHSKFFTPTLSAITQGNSFELYKKNVRVKYTSSVKVTLSVILLKSDNCNCN